MECVTRTFLLCSDVLDQQVLILLEVFDPLFQEIDISGSFPVSGILDLSDLSSPFVLGTLDDLGQLLFFLDQGTRQVANFLQDDSTFVKLFHAGRSVLIESSSAQVLLLGCGSLADISVI